CRDVLFATMDGALWRRLVVERGWTDPQYADWLGRLWVDLFVTPTSQGRRKTRLTVLQEQAGTAPTERAEGAPTSPAGDGARRSDKG
ncbi:MAG: hypothetical protein LC749_09255, partial [Actinobacteria bacterium]|nr:hypothetical protein [Actinomycetota bacterium]